MSKSRELLQLKEQREHLRYLLTRTRLVPHYRLTLMLHLAHVEKLVLQAKKLG